MTMGIVVVAFFAASGRWRRRHNDKVHLETHQFRREVGEPFGPPSRESPLDDDVLTLDPAEVLQPSLECLDPSLDHLIRPLQERRRDRQAERLGGLEVDHQLELRRLLDGQVAGLGALEDLVDVGGGPPVQVESSARKPSSRPPSRQLRDSVHRRDSAASRRGRRSVFG